MTEKQGAKSGYVSTEGDDLYFEVRGEGQPILFIPAAGGDGDYYLPMADILCKAYKVITFDRRANARSTMNHPQNFEISQHSRDAVAILKAAGEASAYVFGNSSGAVIALDMAKNHPEAVRKVVAHEAPITRMLPDAGKWQSFFARCYYLSMKYSSKLGATKFFFGIKANAKALIKAQMKAIAYAKEKHDWDNQKKIDSKLGTDFLMKQELLPVTNYLPDVEKLKINGVNIIIGVGEYGLSKNTWIARSAELLAKELGCQLVTFPGHHGSYMDMPEEWAMLLKKMFRDSDGV